MFSKWCHLINVLTFWTISDEAFFLRFSTKLTACKPWRLSLPTPLFASPEKGCNWLPCRLCVVLCEASNLKSEEPVSSGMMWFKLCCGNTKDGSLALMDSSEGGDTSWYEGSQLPHALSFPSTDLHLDTKRATFQLLAAWEVWRVCVCVCKNCHLLFKPQIYLLPIKEQALFWELTGNVTRTAFT